MITVTFVFDHRNRTSKGKEGPIELRITIDSKVHYMSTGVRVRKNEWRANSVINRSDSIALNERLQILMERANSAVNDEMRNGTFDMTRLKDKITHFRQEQSSETPLIDWCEEQIPLLELRPDSVRRYTVLIRRMREYGELAQWSDLTAEGIDRFNHWLHGLDGVNGKKIQDGGVWNYHKALKRLLNRAVTLDYIKENPYSKLRNQYKRGDVERVDYLTDEEMQRIVDVVPVGSMMQKARDLFVMQMYTGLSYSDTQVFDLANYKKDGDVWVCIGQRVKTGVMYISDLLPPVVEMLNRYDGKAPKLSNQEYNIALKALGQIAGISTPLYSHLARHTFATWMLRHGAKIENISKMLGHTNIKQTQRYARVVAAAVHEDFARMAEKLNQNKPNA